MPAFLIAVQPQPSEPTRVYAVLARSSEAALSIVAGATLEAATIEPAGMLSKRMARSLKLRRGEPKAV